MKRVGLVGCGTIGTRLALALQRDLATEARMVAVHDLHPSRARILARRFRSHPRVCTLHELIRRSDLVLEAASADIAGEVAMRALRAHRMVMVMSVGGLVRDRRWERPLVRSRGRLVIPSGALAGLDGIKAMAMGRIRRAQLTTSKPPQALSSAPYVTKRKLALTRLKRPTVIFEGTPRAAVNAFPQNTNVAAALALASGVPSTRLRVRVVADPTIRRNRHELEVDSDCGQIRCTIQSLPSRNPQTSELAVRSAVATMRQLFARVQIGT